jgi:hypothetical protein
MEATSKQAIAPESCGGQEWIEQEMAASKLPDARLEKRLQHLVEQMAAGLGRSIPLACQDWAATKAAYRFFSNERICEEQILERNQSNRAFEKCLRGGFFLRKKPLCRIALGYSYSGFAIAGEQSGGRRSVGPSLSTPGCQLDLC